MKLPAKTKKRIRKIKQLDAERQQARMKNYAKRAVFSQPSVTTKTTPPTA